jgi:hypothetical protein
MVLGVMLPGDSAVQQKAQPIIPKVAKPKVAKAVAAAQDLLDQKLTALVGPFLMRPVVN